MSDLRIDTHPDGSITITETTIEGKRLAVTYPPEAAHDELVRRGAQCGHRVKHTETEFRLIETDTDELSPATRAQVAEVAHLTGFVEDRTVLKKMRDEFDSLYERRTLAVSDMTDIASRNDTLDALDARMRELRDEMTIYEGALAIAELAEHHHTEEE
jgi:hypothetical protein